MPQQRPAAQSPSRNVASNSSERVSENKVEGAEAGASSEKPSVKEALRQRKERREHKVEESPRRETEKGRSFHMHDPPPAASPKPQRLPEKGSKGSEDQPIQPNNDRSDSEQSVVPDYPFDFSDMRSFLTQPLPIDAGVVQCYIERKKSGFKWMYPEYYLYMKVRAMSLCFHTPGHFCIFLLLLFFFPSCVTARRPVLTCCQKTCKAKD